MKTYNDFLDALASGDSNETRLDFIKNAIQDHKGSVIYTQARVAEEYARRQNVTIREYIKLLYTLEGKAVKDYFSPNYKIISGFFQRFIKQEKSFLLGNGVSWTNPDTADKLGTTKKPFDTQLQKLAEKTLVGGVGFGFFNLDHIEVFSITEFVPLVDEEDGALKAGIRFWQIAPNKPIRATLYEEDGYTEYIWNEPQRVSRAENNGDDNGRVLHEKQSYKSIVKHTDADGDEIYDGGNYNGFPIVPMWANNAKQSELVGLREQIDCYDLIKSGFANTVDEASIVYWLVQNAGGMDDVDLRKFVDRVKTVHAYSVDEEGATAEPHTISYDYQGREALLVRLANDLYKDAMALDVEQIANGAVTATQIEAAYEPLNEKADDFEYYVIDFINGILELAGIEGETPTFTRSYIVNTTEEITNVLQSAVHLSEDYVTQKILYLLGDGDKAEDVMKEMDAQAMMAYQNLEGGEGAEGSAESDEGKVEEVAEQATGKSLTVGQINSIIGIMGQVHDGSLTENQAVNIISIALGISKEQAREVIQS